VTASDKVYDGNTTATIASYSVATKVGSDVVNATGGTATFDTKNVGTGKTVTVTGLTLTGADAANYSLTSTTATATAAITALPLTATVTASDKVYDGNTTATIASYSVATKVGSDVVNATGGTATFDTKNVGSGKTVTVTGLTLTGADAANYSLTSTSATATAAITSKSIAVTALDQTKSFGTLLGSTGLSGVAFTATGLISPDVAGNVLLSFSGNPSGNLEGASVGTYSITPSNLSLTNGDVANYTITYSPATLTVTPAALTITATAQSKTFGSTVSATGVPGTTFTVSGLKFTDAVSEAALAFTGSPAGNLPGASVGNYTITPSDLQFSSGTAANYSISYQTGVLTVNTAALTVTASNQSKVYGTTVSTAGVLNTTYTIAGLQNGDQPSSVTLNYSGTPAGNMATAGVGSYSITPSALTLSSGSTSNYTITYAQATLDVTAASLTITAVNQSKTYGTISSTSGTYVTAFSASGLLNGDTPSSVSLSYTSNGQLATAGVGTYTITPSAVSFSIGQASNYTVSYQAATLTVTAAALTVTASAQSKTYGSVASTSGVFNTTYTISGLQNTDLPASLSLSYSGSPAGNLATAAVGSYTITATEILFQQPVQCQVH